jgi:hypothetical protein
MFLLVDAYRLHSDSGTDRVSAHRCQGQAVDHFGPESLNYNPLILCCYAYSSLYTALEESKKSNRKIFKATDAWHICHRHL